MEVTEIKHAADCQCHICEPYDEWLLTSEELDFAPIWSREDFERRALAEGWRKPDSG